jgi:1,4-alpha-glucan branching enzyme
MSVAVVIRDTGETYPMHTSHNPQFWEAILPTSPQPPLYQIQVNQQKFYDPYTFRESLLSDFDRHVFGEGNHYQIYEKLGAHLAEFQGVKGVFFAVWAPNARKGIL